MASHRSGDALQGDQPLAWPPKQEILQSPELGSGLYDDHSRTKEHATNKILLHTHIHTHTPKKRFITGRSIQNINASLRLKLIHPLKSFSTYFSAHPKFP